jgi:hypothetical protein
MNTAKIAELKQILDAAVAAHDGERDRLAAAGFNSKARYEQLKPLKAAVDAANRAYVGFAHGQINRELDAIIAADRPAREAAARARSPWKQAKFDAANARKAQGL